jgi:virulence factor
MIRAGIVDFDTSHVVEFTKRFNHIDIDKEQWIDGVQVVMGYPGTSTITSKEVMEGYTATLKDKYGIAIVEKPDDMIGQIDAVLIESQGGSVHLKRARPFLSAGIPTFIDKPFTCSLSDAKELAALASANNAPLLSTSSLRYALEIKEVKANRSELGEIIGADAYSPASLHPQNPGLFHYGIHGVETLYALMGSGCRSVSCIKEEGEEVIVGRWKDGRVGTVRGLRHPPHDYGFTAFCEKTIISKGINTTYIYRELLEEVTKMFRTRRAPLNMAETVEIVGFIESALNSAGKGGGSVEIAI